MRKIAKNLIVSLLLVFSLSLITLPVLAQEETGTYDFKSQSGLDQAANQAGYATGAERTTVEDIVSNVIYIVLSFLGILFMGFIIYGGVIRMTADGNEQKVKKANDIIMSSLFGLIITLAAYALTYFLINFVFFFNTK